MSFHEAPFQKMSFHKMPFHKMHGLGNDFIVLDLRDGSEMPSADQMRLLADRRLGIGCDQIMVLSHPEQGGDMHLAMFNADGSVAGACGNGTRCVAWFEMQNHQRDSLMIETISGMLHARNAGDKMIEVNMGKPRFLSGEIPIDSASTSHADPQKLAFDDMPFGPAFCVNMGNPHAVFMVEDAEAVDVEKWGRFYESHPVFPDRANIEFISLSAENQIRMRVYERGAGITRACGSGACAAGVAVLTHAQKTAQNVPGRVEVILDGGSLWIEWAGIDDQGVAGDVLMTGPITYVAGGEYVVDTSSGELSAG